MPQRLDVDARDFTQHRATLATASADRTLQLGGGARAEMLGRHAFTGSPVCFRPTAEAPRAGRSPVARALAYVRRVTEEVARPGEVLEWVPDPRPSTTSAGRRVVHLHQQYRGIPVFEAMRTAIFADEASGEGRLFEVTGDHVPLADGLPIHPALDAPAALLAACRELAPAIEASGRRVTDHPPTILATPGLPAMPTMLHKLPFEDPVSAHLVLFDLDGRGSEEARLGWFLSLSLPGCDGAWELIVEAAGEEAGRLLWARDLVSHARQGLGDVWLFPPGEAAARRRLDFPRPLAELPPLRPRQPLPAGFPPRWIADRGTSGNNTRTKPFNDKILKGDLAAGVCRFFPADPEGRDQRVLNAFFWTNQMHDLFYLLGFDEARGNFQEENFSGAPRAGDRVEVRIERTVAGDASFILAQDGRKPRMTLGETAAGRHTALSADVVIHECVHGLNNRLVGGAETANPMHQSFQSRSLDEGTCDWLALTVQNHARLGEQPPLPERHVFGAWVADDAARGLRPHPYDPYPLTYADLPNHPDLGDHHAAGQVWGAALLEMNRRLGEALGDARHGHEVGWQAMVDALKETARTPTSITFLNTRDRLFEALTALAAAPPARADGTPLVPPAAAADCAAAARAAFSRFGMGPAARGDQPRFEDAVADFQDF